MKKSAELFERRKRRTRFKLRQTGQGRLRLSVFRSSQHIYAQVIDDARGVTIASASTIETDLRKDTPKGCDKAAAVRVGKLIAERSMKAGVDVVVFDRGGYVFHGRVKALADAAREAGLKF